MLKRVPEHGPCFICGSQNPNNAGIIWWERTDGVIVSEVTLSEAQQGAAGFTHGGASAAILDEVMGVAVWRAGYQVVTVNLEVEYRRPVPLGELIQIEGQVVDQVGRSIRARGELHLPDGTVAVIGRGIFVEAPHFFEGPMYQDEET
jgi:uncharacterized protein (TIGR00369 family)